MEYEIKVEFKQQYLIKQKKEKLTLNMLTKTDKSFS